MIAWGHAGSSVLPPGSSTVEVTFEAVAGGTKLTVEHRDLPIGEASQHAIGWAHFLTRLRSAGAGVDPGPDPFGS
ncbi:hypothetical protein GCM10010531_16810 [Blastococcus jejuensis]|uniref:Activator of Hsp90 ATPase homologue 1/2-like C-terminal domain-containing protein n=1 Tax=Blastococcus jejuensis TaxID=351224 RepID=A0ABP6P256_9ACTN